MANRENPNNKYLDIVNPCIHGHTPTYRYKRNNRCVQCSKEDRNKVTQEKRREYQARATAKIRALQPSTVKAYERALNDAAMWHQTQIDIISKRGPNQDQYAISQHREQIEAIKQVIAVQKHRGEAL